MGWFDYLMIVVFAYSLYEGFQKGFIMLAAEVISLFLGYWAANKYTMQFVDWVASMGVSAQFVWWVTAILVFISVVILARLAGKLISKFARLALLGGLNNALGVVASFFKNALILSILIQLSWIAHTTYSVLPPITSELSVSYPFVKSLAPQISPYIEKITDHVR